MSFEVAVYNGLCEDGQKVVNSVKAAYLYADKVRVYDFSKPQGVNEKFFMEMLQSNRAWYEECNHLLSQYPFLDDDNLSKADLKRKLLWLSSEERKDINEALRGSLENDYVQNLIDYVSVLEMMQTEREMNSQYSRDNYKSALSRMGVEYREPVIDTTPTVPVVSLSLENFVESYFDDQGFKLLNDPSSLLDDDEDEEVNARIWTPAHLSEYAISRLPGFNDATLEEVIDIRKELDQYIKPYREAIVRMSQEIKAIPGSESFQHECEELYIREIEPKVAAIKAAIRDNNVIKNIARSAIKSELAWASIGSLVTAFATTGSIANAMTTSTAVAIGGLSVANGIAATIEKEKKIQEQEMFFLYETGQILETEYI